MATSFFFYDLETSGVNPRTARIMQFAGQRTDMNLQPVGEPVNILIKLADDVVPEPEAILITGITPQQTLQDGVTEAEFLKTFADEVAIEGTIFVGFNTIRFDDEFMRYLHYRNFYDPYEWQYQDGKSRWDLLDLVRMTRALRPEGITWPVDDNGKPTNRLELLTKANGISHESAHDALSDVHASIELAQLLRDKQPKLFDYLLQHRTKHTVAEVVEQNQPFLYSSGKYAGEFEKTTAVGVITKHPTRQGVLVFDLRYDPTEFINLSVEELVDAWQYRKDEGVRLPVKTLQYNRCPAIAPLGVLDEQSEKRLNLDKQQILKNYKILRGANFAPKLLEAQAQMDVIQEKSRKQKVTDVDEQLYDGFLAPGDKNGLSRVRATDPHELTPDMIQLKDQRLIKLLPRYKARNYASSLTGEERQAWEQYRTEKLLDGGTESQLARFFAKLGELAETPGLSSEKQYLLEELQLYGQSIMPIQET